MKLQSRGEEGERGQHKREKTRKSFFGLSYPEGISSHESGFWGAGPYFKSDKNSGLDVKFGNFDVDIRKTNTIY